MSIKLKIEIEGPLGPDDRSILTGATMVLLALSQELNTEEEPAVEEPQPCGDLEMTASDQSRVLEATGKVCVSNVGHLGRHKYRDLDTILSPRTIVNTEGLN